MIHVDFVDLDDMMNFAKKLVAMPQRTEKTPVQNNTVVADSKPQPRVQAPVQNTVVAAVPEPQPQVAPVPHTPVAAPIQQAPTAAPPQPQVQAPVQQSVPTSVVTYTLDDLARAAMSLMDSGKQPDLLQLLASFGVEALPALPPAQYGAFATALRGLGAQI